MSGNYAQLKTAADAYKASLTALHVKIAQQGTAVTELEQSTAVLNQVDVEVALRTKQLADAAADLATVTAEKAELTTLRASLITQKAAAVSARNIISDRPIPPAAPGPGTGTLDTAIALVASEKALVPGLVTARDNAFGLPGDITKLNGKRIQIYNENNLLDQLVAALDQAQKNFDQNPTHPQNLTNLNNAKGLVETKRTLIQTETTALGPLEVAYQAAVDALAAKVGQVRAAEDSVVILQNDYDAAYLAALEVTNKLQDIEGSAEGPGETPDDNVADPNGKPTSSLGLATTNETQLSSVNAAILPMKTAALAAQAARKADFDADVITVKNAESATTSAIADRDARKKTLDSLVKVQKKLEIDAACLVLEYFLKNYDLRVASSPGVTPAEDEAVSHTCPGSTVRNMVSRIKLSYSTEAQYLAMCELLTESPVESFFDSTMDECFMEICKEDAESIMADLRSEFGKCASKLISQYGKCGKSSSSGMAWWWWVIIIVAVLVVLAVILAVVFGAGPFAKWMATRGSVRMMKA